MITPVPPVVIPTSTVQPFTYKDGVSFLERLELIVKWINREIIPNINDFEDEVQKTINDLIAQVNAAIEQIINSSVELQDPVMAGIVDDITSQTRAILDTIYPNKTEIDSLEQTVANHTTDIATIENEIATKADSTTVDALNTVVSNHTTDISEIENTLTGHGNDIATLEANKANKSDILPTPPTVTSPIIATHFLTSHEAVYVAISSDGENFEETNVFWKPINNAELGTAYARDPSIVQYGGFYYIAYTRVGSATGGAFGTTKTVGLVRVSSDFATWTPMDPIVMPGNQVNTWAPEWYVGDDGLPSIIVAYRASTNDQFEQYLITPSNPSLTAWNAPQKMVGLTGKIDCTILKVDNTFHAFVADQPEMRMMHYTASAITGPYTKLATSEINTGPFAGLEGPSIVKLNRGGWRMYLDAYGQVDSIYYTDSFDLIHWSALKPVSLPMRHIGTLQVDRMPLRKYPPIRPNIVAAELDTVPYWGAKRKPTDVDKEWVETITINTGSSWHQILPIAQMGFSGVDGMFAQIMHGDNMDVCTVRIQIPADTVVAITLLDFAGNIMTNKTARVAYRIIGWGPAEKR